MVSMRRRILHLFAPASFGGLERVVESLASAQQRSGHEVHVGAILDEDVNAPVVVKTLAGSGVEVHSIRLGPRAYLRERRFVAGLCGGIRPHVAHTHGYRSDVLHGGVARWLGLPTVTTVHGFTGGDWKNRMYEKLQRRACRRFEGVVAVSQPLARELSRAGVAGERLHVVPNAWANDVSFLEPATARQYFDVPECDFAVGFVGRIDRLKGADLFIEALAHVDSRTTGVLVGDGDLRRTLMQRAREAGLDGSVRWPGAVDRAARLLKAFDVVVLSSRSEGTPMVLLEAMAAETPIVATTVGGIPDVVTEREALLVPPEDPMALAGALRRVMNDPAGARARAARARDRLRSEFGAARWLERYDEVYRACGAFQPHGDL